MPLIELPSPSPWLTWLPSEFSDIPGAAQLWETGLKTNAGTALLDVATTVANLWGVDFLAEAEGLLEAITGPATGWANDTAAAALGALGLGTAAIPVAGWIISALSAVASAIVKALSGQRTPPPSPIVWAPPRYRQAVDQDAVRLLLGLSAEADWQEAMRAPAGYVAHPAPGPLNATLPHGGDILPAHNGLLQPGGLADWGWYGWQPPPSGGSSRPGNWRAGDIVTVRGPSVRATQRELWAALLGDTGVSWAVDAAQLRADWEAAGGALVAAALAHAETLGLPGPYLTRGGGLFLLADDATDEVREAWTGKPCLVETLPTGQPFPEGVSLWKGGPHPLAKPSGLAGYRDSMRRHAWLPRTAAQASVALKELERRQEKLAKSPTAAWALPTQPGAKRVWSTITATRAEILEVPHIIEAARIRDVEYRQAVAEAQAARPLEGALPPVPEGLQAGTFDPANALPDDGPATTGAGAGAGGVIMLGALAWLAARSSRRRR